MFYVDILGKDCFFSFRQGAVMFVIGVLGWSGRWWCFGGTSKVDNGVFGFVRNLTDLGHGGGNTVKGPVFECLNRLLDTLFGGEEL